VAFDNVTLTQEIAGPDCNHNGVLDGEEISLGLSADCNGNGAPDDCDLVDGTSTDCNANFVPDECDPDSEADGVADDCDNCPVLYNPAQTDFDIDGLGDVCDPDDDNDSVADPVDCSPFNPNAWSRPGEPGDLLVLSDAVTLSWDPPADPGGTGVGYDLLRSEIPSDFLGSVCVVAGWGATAAPDGLEPPPGVIFSYLVRAVNGCPDPGSLGNRSDGQERQAGGCVPVGEASPIAP
jgi:hypothetical protein